MKVSFFVFSISLLLSIAYAQQTTGCTQSSTFQASVVPTGSAFRLDALPEYNNSYTIVWDESFDNTLSVSISACSNNSAEYSALLFSLNITTDNVALLNFSRFTPMAINASASGSGASIDTPATNSGSTTGGSSPTTTGTGSSTGTGATTGATTGTIATTAAAGASTGALESSTTGTAQTNGGTTGTAQTNGVATGTAQTNGVASGTAQTNGATTGTAQANAGSTTKSATTSSVTVAPLGSTSASGRVAPNLMSIVFIALASMFVIPKTRTSMFLVMMLIAIFAFASPAAAFNATKLSVKITVPSTLNTFCIQGQCFNRASNNITDYVSLFGQRYAILPFLTGTYKCNATEALELPVGWRLAPVSVNSLLVIFLNPWNLYSYVTANAALYTGGLDNVLINGGGQLYRYNSPDSNTGYKYGVVACDHYILIEQDFPIPESAKTIAGPARINNFVTFNGFDYGVSDNAAHSYSPAVAVKQANGVYVDSSSEWTVAPDEDASKLQIQTYTGYTWGTQCLVLNSTIAYNAQLAPCASNNGGIRYIPYGSGQILSVLGTNPSKILFRRPSKLNAANTVNTTVTITNVYIYAGANWATLDNTAIGSSTDQCQLGFVSVPAGWALATPTELSDFIAANQAYAAWPGPYCYATVGATLSPNAAVGNCSATIQSLSVGNTKYYTTTFCGKILIKQSLVRSANFTIGMKILVLSVTGNSATDVQLNLAINFLNSTGVKYDSLSLVSGSSFVYPADLPLIDGNNNPKYYAIILTDADLSYNGASALTANQRKQLNLYKFTFNVRLVALNSAPTAVTTPGVSIRGSGVAGDNAFISFDRTYASGNPVVGGLNTNAGFNITGAFAIKVTLPANAVAVLRYTTSESDVPTTQSDVAAAILSGSDNTTEMHFFIANSVTYIHGPILSNVWLNWVTRGAWIGVRRTHFNPQIDDLFLATEAYDNAAIANRMTGTDLTLTASFLKSLNTPAGSNVTCEFGYNGDGVKKITGTNTYNDGLYNAAQANIAAAPGGELWKFFWESHTFTHLDFTCPESDCARFGPTSYEDVANDVINNVAFAATKFFACTGCGGLANAYYSPNSMITPAITGLFNPAAIKAMLDNGIIAVVGDNSVAALRPSNPYHGFYTTAEANGYAGLFIIPRAATAIYYDVALPVTAINEYNYRYGVAGTLVRMPYNSTLDMILDNEAKITNQNLFLFRHDPYMFHQANLVHFNYTKLGETQAKQWSLYSLWMATVVDYYNKFLTFPMKSMRQQDQYQNYLDRADRDNCGTVGTITIQEGIMININFAATGSCEAAITGTGSQLNSCGDASDCRTEIYGPDTTMFVKLSATTTKSLPASIQWN